MKAAKTTFAFLGIFVLMILSIGFVSAQVLDITAEVVPTNVSHDDETFSITFNLSYTGTEDSATINWSNSVFTEGTATFSFPSTTILQDEVLEIVATISFDAYQSGNIAGTIQADEEGQTGTANSTFIVPILAEPSLIIDPSTQTLTYGENTTISLNNTGNIDLSNLVLSETTSFGSTFSTIVSSLVAGASDTITVILDSITGLKFGTNTLTILATDTSQTEATDTATISIEKTFCDSGEVGGNLTIEKVEIDNIDGADDEWSILDEIEIEINVENNNVDDYDIEDIVIELGFFDSNGDNIIDDFDFTSGADSDGLTDDFDLDEGDDQTITIAFKVPADFEKGDYKLAVKTYSEDLDEDTECADTTSDLESNFYEDIKIERESDDEKSIIVDDINFDNPEATCGQTVSGTFTVFNIGTDDQEKILIVMEQSDLEVYEQFEVLNDMDEGDDGETFPFSFEVPEGIENKNYKVGFTTYSDYDSDGDEDYFEFYKDRSDTIFYETLKVIGCETQLEESVLITTELDSDAEAGEELVITSTITNLGDETATFEIEVTGFDIWAELVSLSEEVTTLAPGESKKVTITLNVNSDAEGTQTFVIETNSNGNLEVQQVEVNIAEGTGFGGFGKILKNSGMLWLIGIINIVLIFLIILVAVRLSRR